MQPVNMSGKRRRKNRKLSCKVSPHMFPAAGSPEELDGGVNRQGQSPLHVACLNGQLAAVRLLAESRPEWLNSSDLRGLRPVHLVLSSHSDAPPCLRYLLERGADVNAGTDSGATPLHLASSEGLLDCVEILVQAGADVLARDSAGHTPLDLACIWCRREVARFLKSCSWQEGKKKELQDRKRVQALYCDLVDMAKVSDLNKKPLSDTKMAEWAGRKGLPPLRDPFSRVVGRRFHAGCLPSDQRQEGGSPSSRRPPAPPLRPWTIFMGLHPERPPAVPDLRDRVVLQRGGASGQLQYTTEWDRKPRPAPDLPLDVLQRVLFPRAFPSRICPPQDIMEVQHRGNPQGRSTSPWTEVAMHLAEVLEPGHY